MGWFDKESKQEEEKIEEKSDKDYSLNIIAGENRYETKLLTYCHFLMENKNKIITEKGPIIHVDPDYAVIINNFLTLNYKTVYNPKDFNFIYEFAKAFEYMTDIFPLDTKQRVFVAQNNDTKSTKVEFKCPVDNDNGTIKEDNIVFDFYTIPSRINTALEALADIEASSELEQYINNGTIEKDTLYVEITREIIRANDDDIRIKNLTLQRCVTDGMDIYDLLWLESIYRKVYKVCEDTFKDLINCITFNLTGLSYNILFGVDINE